MQHSLDWNSNWSWFINASNYNCIYFVSNYHKICKKILIKLLGILWWCSLEYVCGIRSCCHVLRMQINYVLRLYALVKYLQNNSNCRNSYILQWLHPYTAAKMLQTYNTRINLQYTSMSVWNISSELIWN